MLSAAFLAAAVEVDNEVAINIQDVFQCVVVCCSVLQCVAVCCSVLQCVAVRLFCILSAAYSASGSC